MSALPPCAIEFCSSCLAPVSSAHGYYNHPLGLRCIACAPTRRAEPVAAPCEAIAAVPLAERNTSAPISPSVA